MLETASERLAAAWAVAGARARLTQPSVNDKMKAPAALLMLIVFVSGCFQIVTAAQLAGHTTPKQGPPKGMTGLKPRPVCADRSGLSEGLSANWWHLSTAKLDCFHSHATRASSAHEPMTLNL